MRLLLYYALQIFVVVVGFTAVSVVFVTINSSAMNHIANQLVAEAAVVAVNEVAEPLEKFSVQVKVFANTLTAMPNLQGNDPTQPQWAESPSVAFNTTYMPPLHAPVDVTSRIKIAMLRGNPLAAYVYESTEMPDNSTQWVDRGVGKGKAGPDSIFTFAPSFRRVNSQRDPLTINCVFNLTLAASTQLTAPFLEPGYECTYDPNFASTGNHWQEAARAMSIQDGATGRWTAYYGWYDIYTESTKQLMTFAVPTAFSTVPDPILGRIYTTNAASMDLDCLFLTKALQTAKSSLDTIDLAMFWDEDNTVVAWTLTKSPTSDADNSVLLIAGETGTKFDHALKLFSAAGWCNKTATGPHQLVSDCNAQNDVSAIVSDDTDLFTLRRVEHVNAKFSIIINGARANFFGPGERARAVGIAVSVATCVLAVAACLGLWYAISRPLRNLVDKMQLAAKLDEKATEDSGMSMVTEIEEANEAFRDMNTQLLAAKPFMPRHLLLALQDEDDADLTGLADEQRERRPDGSQRSRRHGDTDSTREIHSSVASSQRRSTRKSARSSLTPGGQQIIAPLTVHNVAVLACNITGFSALISHVTTDDLHSCYSEFLDVVSTSVAAQRGVIDSVQGDHILITFNSATRCFNVCARAVHAAFDIREGLKKRSTLPVGWQNVTFGIASSKAQCGAMGTATLKNHATLGHAVRGAVGLQRVARAMTSTAEQGGRGDTAPLWCVATSTVAFECSTFAHYKHITVAQMPPARAFNVITALFPPQATEKNVAPGTVTNASSDAQGTEWLYEVQATAASNPCAAENTEFEKLLGMDNGGRRRFDARGIEFDPDLEFNQLTTACTLPVAVRPKRPAPA